MHGPDGTDYQEWISWTEIAPPERIALLHGESRGDPNAFESVLTFALDGAATRIEMRTVFPTKGDTPDLHRPGTVTVPNSAFSRRGQLPADGPARPGGDDGRRYALTHGAGSRPCTPTPGVYRRHIENHIRAGNTTLP